MKGYGQELILDLLGCNASLFNRDDLERFCIELCELIDMKRGPIHFWDYDTAEEKAAAADHLCGTSVVQFIETSNITIHALDRLEALYLNVFSCKEFNNRTVEQFAIEFFESKGPHKWAAVDRI